MGISQKYNFEVSKIVKAGFSFRVNYVIGSGKKILPDITKTNKRGNSEL